MIVSGHPNDDVHPKTLKSVYAKRAWRKKDEGIHGHLRVGTAELVGLRSRPAGVHCDLDAAGNEGLLVLTLDRDPTS